MKIKDIPIGAWIYSGDLDALPKENSRYYSYRTGTFKKINEQNELKYNTNYVLCFDARERNAPHKNLQIRGSNCYYDSDLRLWLNSSGTDWGKTKNEYESDLDIEQIYRLSYGARRGFMTNLSEPFINSLCSMEIDCNITERDKIKLHGKSKKCYDLFTIEEYNPEGNNNDYGYNGYIRKVFTRTPGEAGYVKSAQGKNIAASGFGNVYPICKMNENTELEFMEIPSTWNNPPNNRLYFPVEKCEEIPDIEIFNIL